MKEYNNPFLVSSLVSEISKSAVSNGHFPRQVYQKLENYERAQKSQFDSFFANICRRNFRKQE
ncbi:MAG: hypothetical protein JSV39_03805 [Candidatus Aenigmatarchaeota archaeon]|nr:MAG: hypothetical protein JSV39_03805 [Candidatus Aenigmarchaeota archaeon]